jgi:NAD(P)-dependent dehydrogenase (short-subunit alcohol dehydrogenase family)
MTDRLTDRVALITGSDSGIGQATAIEFAKEGADVVVTYFEDDTGAKETAREVEGRGDAPSCASSTSRPKPISSPYSMTRWPSSAASIS